MPLKCEKCGKETEGVRRRGPGHPRIPYCHVCYYPKRFAWCPECGGVMAAKSKSCGGCRRKKVLRRKIERLEEEIKKAKAELEGLEDKDGRQQAS